MSENKKEVKELKETEEVKEDVMVEETAVEEVVEEPISDMISRTAVLDLLQKCSARATRTIGNSLNVSSKEMKALINGLINDITNLQ